MGKKKLELNLIRNPSSRHATFYKRKSGLLKKAFELSVLCDAEVALIIFSETGKIYEFASQNDITRILAKYKERARNATPTSLQNTEFDESELKRLHEKMDILQKKEKNMVGEDLESLTMKELHQLEKKLQRSIRCIHNRKVRSLQEEKIKLQTKLSTRGDSTSGAELLIRDTSLPKTHLQPVPCDGNGDGDDVPSEPP